MIVEDEVFVRMGYKSFIRWHDLGMEVVADAANGAEGYEAYLRTGPDIIITDLRMPVMDGMELMRRIREHDSRTQFLIITCLDEFEMAREALSLGAFDYVLKLDANVEDLEKKLAALKAELDEKRGYRSDIIPYDGLPVKVSSALKYIEEAYARDLSLADVAEYVGVTPNYLSRLFSLHLGSSFTSTLNATRIERAKRIFLDDASSVHAVARAVGFTNDTYFIRVFKRQTGMTPNEFRASRRARGEAEPDV